MTAPCIGATVAGPRGIGDLIPYIERARRAELDSGAALETPGDLAYAVARDTDLFLHRNGKPRFADYASALGVLLCVILEVYRCKAAPYEDGKRRANGEVWS